MLFNTTIYFSEIIPIAFVTGALLVLRTLYNFNTVESSCDATWLTHCSE